MQDPTISVVCSVYNGEQTIRETVLSVLGQDFDNFEFLIVDDGSDDSTFEILENIQFLDARIRVLPKRHQGLTNCLVDACNESKGLYIARIDSGDLSRSNRLVVQLERFQSDPELVLCGTEANSIDKVGNTIGRKGYYTRRPAFALMTRNPIAHSSAMFRTDAYRAVGGYRTEITYAQDYELWTRLSALGRIEIIPETLIDERFDTSSLSFTKAGCQAHYGTKASHKYSQSYLRQTLPYSFFQQHFSLTMEPTKSTPLNFSKTIKIVFGQFILIRLLLSMSLEHKFKWLAFFILGPHLFKMFSQIFYEYKYHAT